MGAARFNPIQQKQLVRTLENAWAFVPAPLPPELDLARLALPLATASVAIGELKGAARRLQNPYMLIDPLQRREALTSSAMEGTITTLGDLVLEEAGDNQPLGDDAREAYNYVRAIEATTKMLEKLPIISHRVIKEAHMLLLRGLSPTRGAGKRPGQYKVHQNAVGRPGETIHTARYVPPPPQQTQQCMGELESYINRDNQNPAGRLIDMALVHYQFEAIHPFDDGNGRIGRMLTTLMAQQSGLLDLPILHMSAHLEKNKDEYIDRLFAVSTEALWEDWTVFFLGAVEASCKEATAIVDRIIRLQSDLRRRAQEAGKSPRLTMIVDALFSKSWTNATEVQKICNVTFPTAQSDLKTLVQHGLLREMQGRTSKIYFAPEILALSDRD
jgi:Fic family protein